MIERFVWEEGTPYDSPHGAVRDTQAKSFDGEYLQSESCAKLLNEMHRQLRERPKLPRVQINNLSSGKVYLAKRAGDGWIEFVYYNGNLKYGRSVSRFDNHERFPVDDYSAYWGPIPEFELEGEA